MSTHPVSSSSCNIDKLTEVPNAVIDIEYPGLDLEEPINIENAEHVEDVKVNNVLRMNSGLMFVEGSVSCTATIEGYVFKADAYGLAESKRIYVSDWHWNEHYVAVEISNIPIDIQFSFTFDRKTGDVKTFEFVSASTVEQFSRG